MRDLDVPADVRAARSRERSLALVESLAATRKFRPYRDERGRDPRLSREEGISGAGWAYADLSEQLGNSGITLMAETGAGKALPSLAIRRPGIAWAGASM